jgi:plasmid stability protein
MNEKQLNKIEARLMMRAKRHGTSVTDEAHSTEEVLVAVYLKEVHDLREQLFERLGGREK